MDSKQFNMQAFIDAINAALTKGPKSFNDFYLSLGPTGLEAFDSHCKKRSLELGAKFTKRFANNIDEKSYSKFADSLSPLDFNCLQMWLSQQTDGKEEEEEEHFDWIDSQLSRIESEKEEDAINMDFIENTMFDEIDLQEENYLHEQQVRMSRKTHPHTPKKEALPIVTKPLENQASAQPCSFYKKGTCSRKNCPYLHKDCEHHRSSKGCRFGDKCLYRH